MRFCGRHVWKPAARHPAGPPAPWPAPTLLGAGAIDGSPAGSERTRLGVWLPGGERLERRDAAGVAGIAVVFAGYLQNLPASHDGEAAYVLDRYRAGDTDWIRSANGVFAFAVVDEDADLGAVAGRDHDAHDRVPDASMLGGS
jgi:hypothetical protein